jgi:hypothetical protein
MPSPSIRDLVEAARARRDAAAAKAGQPKAAPKPAKPVKTQADATMYIRHSCGCAVGVRRLMEIACRPCALAAQMKRSGQPS